MKKEPKWPWPDRMYYVIFGEPWPDRVVEIPKDFDLCLEFVMRNFITQEDAAFIRERYEQCLTEREIAARHGLTIDRARGRIYKVIKKLRHPSRARYLLHGMIDGVKREVERTRTAAYKEGYQVGYQDCKEEFLMRDQERKELVEEIRKTLPERVCDLGLSNHAYWTLDQAGVTKVETLLLLSKPQIKAIRGIGRKTADEIFAKAETLGFPLGDGTPKIYE